MGYTFEPCKRFSKGKMKSQNTKIWEEIVEYQEAYTGFLATPNRATYKNMMLELMDLIQASVTMLEVCQRQYGKHYCCYNDEIIKDHYQKDDKRGYHNEGTRV